MARCLEIILLIILVRAADLEAEIVQGDQVSQFVNNVRILRKENEILLANVKAQ